MEDNHGIKTCYQEVEGSTNGNNGARANNKGRAEANAKEVGEWG
jgi:hypothetical protein